MSRVFTTTPCGRAIRGGMDAIRVFVTAGRLPVLDTRVETPTLAACGSPRVEPGLSGSPFDRPRGISYRGTSSLQPGFGPSPLSPAIDSAISWHFRPRCRGAWP